MKAGLFSAISSAFVIDIHSKLQPDPNDQTAVILRAILLTLNQSAIPNETPTVPPIQQNPTGEMVTVTGLMYASLVMSLLAAFIAMLGKQWLNRYLRNQGGSMIERCGDRQRKCDGLKKWPFHLFVESLPVMLQIALLLLVCGLCRHMWSINTTVAGVLITFTALGVLFYIGIVIAGTSSYKCPFQTPLSLVLRSLWKRIGPHVTAVLLPIISTGRSLYKSLPWSLGLSVLNHVWEAIQCLILHVALWFPPHNSHGLDLPIAQPSPQEPLLWFTPLHHLWEDLQCRILRAALHLPHITPLPTIQGVPATPPQLISWLTQEGSTALQKTNANDVRCVSWILWNITDPEALDATIRLAGTVRWFEDGLDIEPPYDTIISSLKTCIDSTGKVYPGSRDRAYSLAQTILWIHIRAVCVSEEFALRFPLPVINCDRTVLDTDLGDLLQIYNFNDVPRTLAWMYGTSPPQFTPAYSQWTSNILLQLSWAKQTTPNIFDKIGTWGSPGVRDTIPVNTLLNRLLVSCILLGFPVDKEAPKIQDKSYAISPFTLSNHSLSCLLVIT